MRIFCSLMLFIFCGAAQAAAADTTLELDDSTLRLFSQLNTKEKSVSINAFPVTPDLKMPVHFRHFEVYAPDARILEITAQGTRELPRSQRIELLGASDDGSIRIALSVDVGLSRWHGLSVGPSGTFILRSERTDKGLRLHVLPADQMSPPGIAAEFKCGDDQLPSYQKTSPHLSSVFAETVKKAAKTTATSTLTIATIAIDTDYEFINSSIFTSGDPGHPPPTPTDWIADLFTSLNVMYQRDLNVMLLQGTTILRTDANDPYSYDPHVPVNANDVIEFSTYWQNNYSDIPRTFAALLSGKSTNPNRASGLAQLGGYCDKTVDTGGYSVTQIYTDEIYTASTSARVVGHELGHNFGVVHTHCTDTTGAWPTGTNTLDQCFNGESGSGCYAGTPVCPSAGFGTVMSYCNVGQVPGCYNQMQFHTVQIDALSTIIVTQTPSCLKTDNVFNASFE